MTSVWSPRRLCGLRSEALGGCYVELQTNQSGCQMEALHGEQDTQTWIARKQHSGLHLASWVRGGILSRWYLSRCNDHAP
jgi:hypothetical protein